MSKYCGCIRKDEFVDAESKALNGLTVCAVAATSTLGQSFGQNALAAHYETKTAVQALPTFTDESVAQTIQLITAFAATDDSCKTVALQFIEAAKAFVNPEQRLNIAAVQLLDGVNRSIIAQAEKLQNVSTKALEEYQNLLATNEASAKLATEFANAIGAELNQYFNSPREIHSVTSKLGLTSGGRARNTTTAPQFLKGCCVSHLSSQNQATASPVVGTRGNSAFNGTRMAELEQISNEAVGDAMQRAASILQVLGQIVAQEAATKEAAAAQTSSSPFVPAGFQAGQRRLFGVASLSRKEALTRVFSDMFDQLKKHAGKPKEQAAALKELIGYLKIDEKFGASFGMKQLLANCVIGAVEENEYLENAVLTKDDRWLVNPLKLRMGEAVFDELRNSVGNERFGVNLKRQSAANKDSAKAIVEDFLGCMGYDSATEAFETPARDTLRNLMRVTASSSYAADQLPPNSIERLLKETNPSESLFVSETGTNTIKVTAKNFVKEMITLSNACVDKALTEQQYLDQGKTLNVDVTSKDFAPINEATQLPLIQAATLHMAKLYSAANPGKTYSVEADERKYLNSACRELLALP